MPGRARTTAGLLGGSEFDLTPPLPFTEVVFSLTPALDFGECHRKSQGLAFVEGECDFRRDPVLDQPAGLSEAWLADEFFADSITLGVGVSSSTP